MGRGRASSRGSGGPAPRIFYPIETILWLVEGRNRTPHSGEGTERTGNINRKEDGAKLGWEVKGKQGSSAATVVGDGGRT